MKKHEPLKLPKNRKKLIERAFEANDGCISVGGLYVETCYVYVLDTGKEPKAIFEEFYKLKMEKIIKDKKLTCIVTKFPLNVLFNMDKDTMGNLDHEHWENGKKMPS